MKLRRWRWIAIVAAFAIGLPLMNWLIAVNGPFGYHPPGGPTNHSLDKATKDDHPRFQLDPAQPWRMEFGRGSGMMGLNTVKLDQDGKLVLHRWRTHHQDGMSSRTCETASLALPPASATRIIDAMENLRLMKMHKAYYADVHDGTQWIFWIRQGNREKAIYFDNHFPEPILRFAVLLDAIIQEASGPDLRWNAVLGIFAGDHQRDLWESIRR